MNIPQGIEGQGIEGKASWITVATSARVLGHPLVWSAITALFILIGYFWLQYYALPHSNDLTEESQGTQNVTSELASNNIGSKVKSHWNPEIYKDIKAFEVMPITNEKDDSRASDYRRIIELEGKILPLLNNAADYMNAENYVFPVETNAWSMYSQVLELDTSHQIAASGQDQILQTLQENAELAVDDKQYENSERWLSQLDEILPGNPFQTQMRKRIAQQINEELLQAELAQKEVEKLSRLKAALDDATLAMNAEPAKLRAAFDLYTRALEIDPENSGALSGLKSIHLVRIDRASNAINLDEFETAKNEINRLRETDATQQQLQTLAFLLDEREQTLANLEQAKLDQAAQTQLQTLALQQANKAKLTEQIAANQQVLKPVGNVEAAVTPNNSKSGDKQIEIITTQQAVNIDSVEPNLSKPEEQQVPKELAALFTKAVKVDGVAVNKPIKPLDVVNNGAKSKSVNKAQLLANGVTNYYSGNYNKAFELLHPLAEDGVARAQFRLGIMYFQGRTVVKNQDLAAQWIAQALPTVLRAAQQNVAWAQSDLGTAYEMGIGVQQDLGRSAQWYKKAAENNYAGAQTNLGVLYGTGEGVNYDRQLAVYWLKRAAEQGDKVAQDNLEILNAK